MKVLCVLTNVFPYENCETYLETEVQYYDRFSEAYICSLMLDRNRIGEHRSIPEGIHVVPVYYPSRIFRCIGVLATITDKTFYKEISNLRVENRFSLSRVIQLVRFLSKAHCDALSICHKIRGKLLNKEIVLYSYRFEYQTYVAILVKRKLKALKASVISRAHRYDLYEEQNQNGYIPCRALILDQIKGIYPCSFHGKEYLINKFPEYAQKITTKYLGTRDCGIENVEGKKGVLSVVSCSNITAVKRIDKIVDTIRHINCERIDWTHYGDGDLKGEIIHLTKTLPKSVSCNFKGSRKNSEVLRDYKNKRFDLFINLSDSEGLPVSIMEAMSFGIPCVATNTDGIPEIVINGYNGILVEKNDEPSIIAKRIVDNLNNLNLFRTNARKTWEQSFTENNYQIFFDEIVKM